MYELSVALRPQRPYGLGAQDVHLDVHTTPELCEACVRVKCCLTSNKDRTGYKGLGAQDVHLDFHTAPDLCGLCPLFFVVFTALVHAKESETSKQILPHCRPMDSLPSSPPNTDST